MRSNRLCSKMRKHSSASPYSYNQYQAPCESKRLYSANFEHSLRKKMRFEASVTSSPAFVSFSFSLQDYNLGVLKSNA